MKYTTLLFLLLCTLGVQGQSEFSKVITVQSSETKDIVFAKVKEWAAKNWKEPKNMVQLADMQTGKVIIKALLKTSPASATQGPLSKGTSANIDITIKDGMAQIAFNYIYYEYRNAGAGGKEMERLSYEQIKSNSKQNPQCDNTCREQYLANLNIEIQSIIDDFMKYLIHTDNSPKK